MVGSCQTTINNDGELSCLHTRLSLKICIHLKVLQLQSIKLSHRFLYYNRCNILRISDLRGPQSWRVAVVISDKESRNLSGCLLGVPGRVYSASFCDNKMLEKYVKHKFAKKKWRGDLFVPFLHINLLRRWLFLLSRKHLKRITSEVASTSFGKITGLLLLLYRPQKIGVMGDESKTMTMLLGILGHICHEQKSRPPD